MRAVKEEGNIIALDTLNKVFEIKNSWWRGIGLIENSGLKLKKEYEEYDAIEIFNMNITPVDYMPEGCRCGDVLKGIISPYDCPLFGKICNPNHPIGPCMVSFEGACSIAYKYKI